MIATFAASAVARFQLKPIATVGTSAAANVPQPKVPSSATRSSFEKRTKSAAPTAMPRVAVRAQNSSFFNGLPKSALGMSWMIAAAPMFRNPSAVDMMAANSPAKTTPARTGWAYACRKAYAASSGWPSSVWSPATTRARIAKPMAIHKSAAKKPAIALTMKICLKSRIRLFIISLVMTCG